MTATARGQGGGHARVVARQIGLDLAMTPGPHGGDARRVAHELGLDPGDVIDLSASLNPFAPDPTDIIRRHLSALHEYPDAAAATEVLADAIGVSSERLVLTNGGAEAIALVAGHLGKGSVVDPDFSLYRRHLATVDQHAGRWRSNPASPLGTLAAPDEQAEVWDEAFYPLATGEWTRGDETSWRLGSLTKLWRCPGLRLGYVIAPDGEGAEVIRAMQPRWSVNGMALSAMSDFLAITDLPGWTMSIASLRTSFTTELERLGLGVTPSTANWVLVHDAAHLRMPLARAGIVVRDCSSFGMPTTVRIALPKPHEFECVLSSIAAVQ
jgi:histidinol-phosphate/aromatic aminotransferase/cobyric acid decarboxylase-like protein